ncbi:hypothetical protein V2H45_02850 [Tumidithrix elongata RA019]|uniref:Uncharacterized protein n=1 Tax=Tumidithrix elongata BACA0141 TaxID=2716417 RepID=A0AAW9PXJ5_9CYAN|nr:hypothetical protein [Tumidithrix elongata RA019]
MSISIGGTGAARQFQGLSTDSATWQNLKQVIASSSGFDKWQRSRETSVESAERSNDTYLDELVASYLRETLETLAY